MAQQYVDDPLSLLQPPSGYSRLYMASYDLIANDIGRGLCGSTFSADFGGAQFGPVNVLSPDQVKGLAPGVDGAVIAFMHARGYSVYGTLIFYQSTSGPFGSQGWGYRYVAALGGPC